MKTSGTFKAALAAVLFILCFGFMNKAYAQTFCSTGYGLKNITNYTVNVNWEVVDNACMLIQGGNVTLGPNGGSYVIPMNMYSPGIGDVLVFLHDVNGDFVGVEVSGTGCGSFPSSQTGIVTTPNGYTLDMYWSCFKTQFQ